MQLCNVAAYVAAISLLIGLGSDGALPRCVSGEIAQHDLVLLKSFDIKSLPAGDCEWGNCNETQQLDVSGPGFLSNQVAFSKSGRLAVSSFGWLGAYDGDVTLYDIETGAFSHSIPNHHPPDGALDGKSVPISGFHCFLSPQPYARLCLRTASGINVQDDLAASEGKPVLLEHLRPTTHMNIACFSTDGRYFAAVCHGRTDEDRPHGTGVSVNVWNTLNGERLCRCVLPDMYSNRLGVYGEQSLAFDASASLLAMGTRGDLGPDVGGLVIVWNMKTGKEVLSSRERLGVQQVTFCPNGDLAYGELGRWDTGPETFGRITIRKAAEIDNEHVAALNIHAPNGVTCVAVVPQIGGILSGDIAGQVLLWDAETGRLLAVGKDNGHAWVASLAVSQDGKYVLSGEKGSKIRLWEVK